jgi:hypothetical protein
MMDISAFVAWCCLVGWFGFQWGKMIEHTRMLKRLSVEQDTAEERYVALYRSFVERGHVVDAEEAAVFYPGTIEDVRMYPHTLSADEVLTLYNEEAHP